MANVNSNAGSNTAGDIPPRGGAGPGSSIGSNAGRSLGNADTTHYVDPATLGVDPNYPVPTDSVSYRPNRKEREVRRQVYIRYYQMRDNDWRTEAEHQWEMADKEYQLWMSEQQQYITTTNSDLGTTTYASTSSQIPDPDDTKGQPGCCCSSRRREGGRHDSSQRNVVTLRREKEATIPLYWRTC